MPTGYAAASAQVIEWKDIKKICPKEAKAFEKALRSGKIPMDEYARLVELEEQIQGYQGVTTQQQADAIDNALDALCFAFHWKTTVGESALDLAIGYHDSDEMGDIHDEVNGLFWYVDGTTQLSPAGEKWGKYVKHKNFVQHG